MCVLPFSKMCCIGSFKYALIGVEVCMRAGACLVVPGEPPLVDFAIDSGVGMGFVYILSIPILLIDTVIHTTLYNLVPK